MFQKSERIGKARDHVAKHVLASFFRFLRFRLPLTRCVIPIPLVAVSYLRYYLTAAGLSQERGRGLVNFGMDSRTGAQSQNRNRGCVREREASTGGQVPPLLYDIILLNMTTPPTLRASREREPPSVNKIRSIGHICAKGKFM